MDYQNNYNYNQNQPSASGGALGWDDEIQEESSFVLLPEGDYFFRIMKVDKGRYEGGTKIGACPKAIVEFEITSTDGRRTVITENYLLHSDLEWKLSEFFAAVGMKQKGEKLRMNWSPALIGKTGVAKIIVNTYQKNGEERQNNKIKMLYPSYDQPTLAPPQQNSQQAQGYNAPPAYNAPPQNYQSYQPQNGWNGGNR